MLGYVHGTTKTWRIWDPVCRRITLASDVRFAESRPVRQRDTVTAELEVLKSCIPDYIPVEDEDEDTLLPVCGHGG